MLANSHEVVEQEPFCADARSSAGMRLAQTSVEIQKNEEPRTRSPLRLYRLNHISLFWLHKHGRHQMAVLNSVVVRVVDCVVIGSVAIRYPEHMCCISRRREEQVNPKPQNQTLKGLSTDLPHILAQNLYYSYYCPNPKYLIIGYMDPLGSLSRKKDLYWV